jgi:hypothetical protein
MNIVVKVSYAQYIIYIKAILWFIINLILSSQFMTQRLSSKYCNLYMNQINLVISVRQNIMKCLLTVSKIYWKF